MPPVGERGNSVTSRDRSTRLRGVKVAVLEGPTPDVDGRFVARWETGRETG